MRQASGDPAALTAKSCALKRRRQPQVPPMLVRQIRWLREKFPNLGKAKLRVLLRPWCRQQDIAQPSVSAIGRIIARDSNKMRHTPTRLSARGHHKPLKHKRKRKRKTRKAKGFKHQPLEVFACDTVVRLRDGLRDGLRRTCSLSSTLTPASLSPLTRCANGCQNRRASSAPITARSSYDASSNASMPTA